MRYIEKKAMALLNASEKKMGLYKTKKPQYDIPSYVALYLAIEQHEATKQELSDFRQEVSEVASSALAMYDRIGQGGCMTAQALHGFIIPAPKPDPLVEAMADCGVDRFESWADQLRAALDARGLEIREKNDD